jgi:23S rRNA (uracil1939-C5)-methyltransferase
VADGIEGRRLNRLDERQCRFIAGRVEDALERRVLNRVPDAVVLDPPRSGCDRRALRRLVTKVQPPLIVYVSCNPETLAADVKVAAANGYAIAPVQPVDMFPHTEHIEAVAVLHR